jgi:hypothetical protein
MWRWLYRLVPHSSVLVTILLVCDVVLVSRSGTVGLALIVSVIAWGVLIVLVRGALRLPPDQR